MHREPWAPQSILERFGHRNERSAAFFERDALRLARVCQQMANRFGSGGRLLAFGSGAAASDAQHIAVEFLHPVLAGKRALPAIDLSTSYRDCLRTVVRAEDIVVGLAGPGGDPDVARVLGEATAVGALTIGLPGSGSGYSAGPLAEDPFVHQEMVEVLYHTLWESVHVFLERESVGHGHEATSFLYPFLGEQASPPDQVVEEVAASIRSKAAVTERLRTEVAASQGEAILRAARAMHGRLREGGAVLCFGNGGSATDATDMALDLMCPPKAHRPWPAFSLANDASVLTALANDIAPDAQFARQLMALARPDDVAVAFSTSGGSPNVVAGLAEARKRGVLTIAMLGYGGGDIVRHRLADHVVVVPADQIPRIQEVHASTCHVLLDLLDALEREGT